MKTIKRKDKNRKLYQIKDRNGFKKIKIFMKKLKKKKESLKKWEDGLKKREEIIKSKYGLGQGLFEQIGQFYSFQN